MTRAGWISVAKTSLLVLLVVGALEGIGALALRTHMGRLPSLAELRAQRQALTVTDPNAAARRAGLQRPRADIVIHPYLGYVWDPAANTSSLSDYGLSVNDFGLLDVASPIHRAGDDETIVGITGGSVAFWLTTTGLQTLERELRASPQLRSRKLTFVRLALGGYKAPQQLMLLSYLLAQGAHFDILVNIDGFNEVAFPPVEHLPANVNPVYPRSWPLLVAGLDLGEQTILVAGILTRTDRRRWWAAQMDRTLLGRSYAANAVWKLTDDIAARENASATARISSLDAEQRPFYLTGPPSRYRDAAAIVAATVPIWRDTSIQLDRLCRGNGIHYFHFLQPNQYDPGSKPIGPEEARVALNKDQPYAQGVVLGYPLLRRAGGEITQAGVAFTDLSRVFTNHPEPTYRDDCCHLNAHGNELLARVIGRRIVEQLASSR
jgi:hypothetical protein